MRALQCAPYNARPTKRPLQSAPYKTASSKRPLQNPPFKGPLSKRHVQSGLYEAPLSGDIFSSLLRGGVALQFVGEVDHLSNVMLDVGGALQEDGEAGVEVGAVGGVGAGPIFRGLIFYAGEDHGDGLVEETQGLVFGGRIGIIEFARAVANVAGLRDLRADVVVQVSGEVQHEMAEAVAGGVGLAPELGVGERGSEFADAGGVGGVAVG